MTQLGEMLKVAATQDNPIDALRIFLEKEERYEQSRQTDKMRFVGYVLELGYDSAKIITSDPYKLAVGGIPRGSFLIMTLESFKDAPPHFTLLRVTGVTPTPLSSQVQQTYFELHKKSMPELDVWTQGELQWGALTCDVLGMFYARPDEMQVLDFSGDVNNVVSAHRYKVFAPDDALLNLIVNGMVKVDDRVDLGKLRTMECGLFSGDNSPSDISVKASMRDFKGCRTAMFGKTRLGKSNMVKLLAKGMLDATSSSRTVGQLIFDINGEYANDNPQDGNLSLRSTYEDRCHVYALTPRKNTPSRPLRLNFYEQPASCLPVLASLLEQDNKVSNYIRSFASVNLESLDSLQNLNESARSRAARKIQMYWAILHKAGYKADEQKLSRLLYATKYVKGFDVHFNKDLRKAAYGAVSREVPDNPQSLGQLVSELEIIAKFNKDNSGAPELSKDGIPVFDSDDSALLDFLSPVSGSGPTVIRAYKSFHGADAGNFQKEILEFLDQGETVILDLGNATDNVRQYFSNMLSSAVFSAQEKKFVENTLGESYVQLYFEEAHNLFPPDGKDLTGVYARFAKEGAKFHIGMIYSTQSPSTINKELLAQTENFFIGHLSSQDEARALSRLQVAFSGVEEDILRSRTPGYMRMLTLSHRFVIPMQANRFSAKR
ncbi:ATP-binding protein [Pseudomonas mosselii]|uniref:ATP-binding protein n=1 Tax=Pseudomonas mosselii TaxID=78327 RepID=UPI001F21C4AF|nr:DUF87 domain-containing protein [Pseudomonas mosselii]